MTNHFGQTLPRRDNKSNFAKYVQSLEREYRELLDAAEQGPTEMDRSMGTILFSLSCLVLIFQLRVFTSDLAW